MPALLARHASAAVVTAILLALAACATPLETRLDAAGLVWPSPPAAPRVVFVQSVAKPADLGITKGFLQRLTEFIFGETDARLIRPMAVIEVNNVIYIADPGAKGVHRFDRQAGRYDLIRVAGGAPLVSPVGLARGPDSLVYVTDSALAGVFLIRPRADFAEPIRLADALHQPTGIAFDADTKRLYVADTASHCVKVYTAEGRLLSTIGQRGAADGEFNFPTMLWLSDSGQLLVTDSLNFRTQTFDREGRFLAKFGRPGDGSGDAPRQKGVATDRYGHVYLVDSLLHAVQIFDTSGVFLLSIGGLGAEAGEFRLPTGIFIGKDDVIYVADSYNQRIQIFRYVGGPT